MGWWRKAGPGFIAGLLLGAAALGAGGGFAIENGRVVLRPPNAPAPLLLAGVGYCAWDRHGPAFETTTARLGKGRRIQFALRGPAAGSASVEARYTLRPHGVTLDWRIRYSGPPRPWNHWRCGFRIRFGRKPARASSRPLIQWVRPTGKHPWETPGDTPYPDTECQLREVFFEKGGLAMIAAHYDPDWFYRRNLARIGFSRLPLPPGSPCTLETKITFLAIPSGTPAPAPQDLAAEAAGQPLSLGVSTGRLGNLFAPGESLPLAFRVANISRRLQACTLGADVWTYSGRRLLHIEQPLILPRGARGRLRRRLRPRRRGILFVAARLQWPGGRRTLRTTIGILPPRHAGAPRPKSPFGLAAVIADPQRYPDQFDLDTVLGLAERIGVRWLRIGWRSLRTPISAAERRRIQTRFDILRRHGISPHIQLGARIPSQKKLPEFRRRFEAAVRRLARVSPYIEVGNELNLTPPGKQASVYVNRLLRPVSEIMRRVYPAGRVMSMGLGGVQKKWLDAFVAAGGMNLIDVLSVHPGCHPRAPEFWKGWRGWVFRSQMLDAMRAARENGGKDVWITEAYSPTPPKRSGLDLRTSADYLVRLYACALALGVKVIEFYQFQDGVWYARRPRPDDVEYNFGLLYSDLTPKPAYIAYGVMTEQLDGAVYCGRMDLGAPDLYGLRFQQRGQRLDVLWSYREKNELDVAWWPPEKFRRVSRRPLEPWVPRWRAPVTISLPAPGAVTVTDIIGNRRRLNPKDGKITLRLTGSPVYVRGLGPVRISARFWKSIP